MVTSTLALILSRDYGFRMFTVRKIFITTCLLDALEQDDFGSQVQWLDPDTCSISMMLHPVAT